MALKDHQFDDADRLAVSADRAAHSRFETYGVKEGAQFAVETIEQVSRFEELEPYWNDLYTRIASPKHVFQTFNWHWHWCNHYFHGSGMKLRIVAVWSDDRLVMVWPLLIKRSLGVRQLQFMGAPVSQYGDVLVDEGHAGGDLLTDVWNYIQRHIKADVIALEKVRGDSPAAPLLKSKPGIVTSCAEAPFLDLASASDYANYEMRFSGRTRKNRRRQRRRLGELGPVRFQTLTEGPVAQKMVGQAIFCKREWLKKRGFVSRAFADAKFDAFFTDVAGSVDRPTGCIVGLLYSNSRPVAYDIGFYSGNNIVAHIGAYDGEYERFGPGGLLTENTLKYCYERGIEHYDFMAPKADYKMSWADGCVEVCDYAYPLSGIGSAYARGILWFVRNAIKNVLAYLPVSARRLTHRLFRVVGY